MTTVLYKIWGCEKEDYYSPSNIKRFLEMVYNHAYVKKELSQRQAILITLTGIWIFCHRESHNFFAVGNFSH
jgi:hypothetical protein